MRIINSNVSLSPYFNLATEEYFLEGRDNVFMLWRNGSSVIVGKNQNTFAEVDIDFCNKNGIKIARRLTGGGAVFHDEGNVNFSFITDADENGIDFARFLMPIIEMLGKFGIEATADGRNDIVVGDKKISGNAQCVYDTTDGRKRLLHHGTLLFSADVSKMSAALKVNKQKLESKGIKSVSSRVANICDLPQYSGPKYVTEFISELIKAAQKTYSANAENLKESEIREIEKLAETKFSAWDWNFGTSPLYVNENTKRFDFGTVSVKYTADHGVITAISVSGDFFGERDIKELVDSLTGTKLAEKELSEKLINIEKYIRGATPQDIINLIF